MIQEDAWMYQRLQGAPDFSTDAITTQLKRLLTAMTAAFPHTSVIMQATYAGTPDNSAAFEQWMIANRIVPSSADTVGQTALNNGTGIGWGMKAYIGTLTLSNKTVAPDLRQQTPSMMDVEGPDIMGGYFKQYGGPYTPQDVLDGLNKTYQASHAFWTYLNGTEVFRSAGTPAAAKWSNLATFLDANPLTRTAYPANYP